MTDRKTIEKRLAEFTAKEQKARADYDAYADTRNKNRWERYLDLKEICELALENVDSETKTFNDFRVLEDRSIQAVVQQINEQKTLGKTSYTADEVKNLLWKTMY